MSKPTLHEIAAMPFPQSQDAMRKHYNPDWHKPEPDPSEAKRKFRVSAEWTAEGSFVEVIEADDEAEAKSLAKDYAADDASFSTDIRVVILSVTEVEASAPAVNTIDGGLA